MSEDEQQLAEAVAHLRLISATVTRTQREALTSGAESFIGWGVGLVIGFAVSAVLEGWLVTVWWLLVGIGSGIALHLRQARLRGRLSQSGRWLMSRYALVGLGLNVQGWALTLLSTLYHAFPPAYIPVIWMLIVGVNFVTSALFTHPALAAIGLSYIVAAVLSALFWMDDGMLGVAYIVVGLGSGFSLIGLGLYLRRQRGERTAHRAMGATLQNSEVVS